MAEKIKYTFKKRHWKFISVCLIFLDFLIVTASFGLALWLRFDGSYSAIPPEYYGAYIRFLPVYFLWFELIFWLMRQYQRVWRFFGMQDLMSVLQANLFTGVLHILGITLLYRRMPLSYYCIGICLQTLGTTGIRLSYRIYLMLQRQMSGTQINRVMIIGAGEAGQMILRDIVRNRAASDRVFCIIDDNPNKQHRLFLGVPVFGSRSDIFSAVDRFKIDTIIFAIPSASAEERRDILNICSETGCRLKQISPIYVNSGKTITVNEASDVAIEDLLGRKPINIRTREIFDFLQDQVVLVTGGGGSIGSELCRQIARHNPKTLIIFDIYENNAYSIQLELKDSCPGLDLVTLIGSVRDSRRLEQIFHEYRPDIVFHAAAHKHVPLMEDSPCESIKNNVFGTYKTAYMAMKYHAKRFVLVSTDKAVNPTNIMGASKRMCEMVVQSFDKMVKANRASEIPDYAEHTSSQDGILSTHTEFVAVRFGNVLGSNGSVVPLFQRQIRQGGPVTVTHPDIIRYFMTIPEAVSLILQAGANAHGGEIYVLDMGEPVKIDTLARNLIRLSGLEPDVDISVTYTGLRPGEKLYEEKLMAEEGLEKTANDLIYVARALDFRPDTFLRELGPLQKTVMENDESVRESVEALVPTYHPAENSVSRKKAAVMAV